MKTYTTRLELHNAWKATRAIIQALANALEIANRSDCSSRHDDENQTGNRPHWASSSSVFGDIQTALDRIITDTFGVTLGELNVNWGAHGSFSKDIFESLATVLVNPSVLPPSVVAQHLKNRSKVQRRVDNACLNPELKKATVRSIARDAVVLNVITQSDFEDICRILDDRKQCAEDALSEVQGSVNARA